MSEESLKTEVKVRQSSAICGGSRSLTILITDRVLMFYAPQNANAVYRFHIDDIKVARKSTTVLKIESDLSSLEATFQTPELTELWYGIM